MKFTVIKTLAVIALAVVIVSCGSSKQDSSPTTTQVAAPTSIASELGTSKAAGPYSVVLMSPAAELLPGDATLMAHVTKDGKAVEDAKVEVELSMPSMDMDSHLDLKHTTGNTYEGVAKLMPGEYKAKVEIVGSAGKGAVEFSFSVK